MPRYSKTPVTAKDHRNNARGSFQSAALCLAATSVMSVAANYFIPLPTYEQIYEASKGECLERHLGPQKNSPEAYKTSSGDYVFTISAADIHACSTRIAERQTESTLHQVGSALPPLLAGAVFLFIYGGMGLQSTAAARRLEKQEAPTPTIS